MATSGSFTGTTNNENITPQITWSATQSTALNASEVTAILSYTRNNAGYETYGTWVGSITIGGKKLEGTKSVTIKNGSYTEVIRHTATINHNSDGTKTITISALGAISGTTLSKTTISKSITLDTILRESTISCSNLVIGEQATIKINRASSDFTHTITYTFGSLSGTIATKTTATTVYWDVPESFYEELNDAASGTVKITCRTYNGTNSIGTHTISKTVSIGASEGKPDLAPIAYDTDEYALTLTGNRDILIKNNNRVYAEVNATPKYEATIAEQSITDGEDTIAAGSGYFENTNSEMFTFSATDSRGYRTVQTLTKTMIDYFKPSCTLDAKNPDTSGTIAFTIKGNFFNGSFGAQDNTIALQYRIKEEDDSFGDWIDITTVTINGNTYSVDGAVTGLDYRKKYTLQAILSDKIYSGSYRSRLASNTKTVKAIPVFDWGADDFEFNVPVKFNAGFIADEEPEEPETPEDNVVLWSGSYYMTEGQTATLSAPVSAQKSGIVLIFSRYDITNSSAMNEHFSSHYVPKQLVVLHEGKGSVFTMSTVTHSFTASKYLYIYNDRIEGNENNDMTLAKGTADDSVIINNNRFVLRYVIGV